MDSSINHRRWMTGVLLAAIVTATVAPAAQAGHGRYTRYKYAGPRVVTRYHSPGSVYVIRRSGPGPVIAGFLGGLFLGATLAHAAPAGYSYYDPYCDERFMSLEVYRTHLYRHHHPRIVRVIEVDTGDCVRSYQYQDGNWRGYDDPYNRDDRYNQDDRYNRDDQYDRDRQDNQDDQDRDRN
jgi:hypothetical protein